MPGYISDQDALLARLRRIEGQLAAFRARSRTRPTASHVLTCGRLRHVDRRRRPDETISESTETTVKENHVTPSTYSRSYPVTGMTCGHCVASVTEELEELAGVRGVNVDLVAGGTSTVTITSDRPLTDDVVKAAVAEAGYRMA